MSGTHPRCEQPDDQLQRATLTRDFRVLKGSDGVGLDEHLEFERFEPREFVAQGDTVVVVGIERSLSKATGRTIEQEWAHVNTLRDGKIAKFRAFEDTAAYVDAFHRRGV